MIKLPIISKDELSKLYSSGQSLSEVAKTLGTSVHKIRYWMNKYNLKTRSISEGAYLKANPDGDPFKIKDNFSKNEVFLLGLGIGIYWGEGTKSDGCSSLKVANSDPGIIRTFTAFLKSVCQLKTERFSYSIVCFNDTTRESARKYWSKELNIPPEKFGKITVIPKQGRGTYKKKSSYGVCTIQGNNVKLRRWVLDRIEKTRNIYGNAWIAQLGERAHGKGKVASSILAPGSKLDS